MTNRSKSPPTKTDTIRRLIARPNGAKLTALCNATGWQAHSVRAALSGLRKSGVTVERTGTGMSVSYRAIVADETVDA